MSTPQYPYLDDDLPGSLDGDPETVRRFAASFNETAEALRDAARKLRSLANENLTISLAIDEVREKADDAQGDTDKVAIRYEGAGAALMTYKVALKDALDKAEGARSTIVTNNDDARWWRSKRRELEDDSMYGGTLTPEQTIMLDKATDKTIIYSAHYGTAMSSYDSAVEAITIAAKAASAALDEAAAAAKLNDDFWEGVQGAAQLVYELAQKYLAPLIEQLRGILELIKSIVDLISLIVSIVAIFVPALLPLAGLLTVISLALSAMILICSVVLFALGKESLGRVLGDAVGLVVGIVTSKLGGAGAAHAAEGAVAGAGQTFSQVAAANGGKLTTIFEATLEVTAKSSKDALIDLGIDAGKHLLNTGLDIKVDQFPNANGLPAESDGGVLSDGGITWDLNTLADPKAHSTFIMDQIFNNIPGFGEVTGVAEKAGDLFGADLSFSSVGYDAIAAS